MPNFNTAKNPSFAPPRPPREGDGDGDASPYSQVTAAEQVYAASPAKTVRRKKKKAGGITITGEEEEEVEEEEIEEEEGKSFI